MISKEDRWDNLILVTASDIGSNHRILCVPNQDASAYSHDKGDFVLAVSDGVGSCKMAEKGSIYAVDTCLKLFNALKAHRIPFDNKTLVLEYISIWKSMISDEQYDDYSSTVKAVFKIGNQIKIISLGDGFAAVSSEGVHLFSPHDELYFTNETRCLSSLVSPDEFWLGDFRLDMHKPFVVFCCTDGVENGIIPGKELDLIEDIEKKISPNELKLELERLICEIGSYCFDDKTVGVAKYDPEN